MVGCLSVFARGSVRLLGDSFSPAIWVTFSIMESLFGIAIWFRNAFVARGRTCRALDGLLYYTLISIFCHFLSALLGIFVFHV